MPPQADLNSSRPMFCTSSTLFYSFFLFSFALIALFRLLLGSYLRHPPSTFTSALRSFEPSPRTQRELQLRFVFAILYLISLFFFLYYYYIFLDFLSYSGYSYRYLGSCFGVDSSPPGSSLPRYPSYLVSFLYFISF